METINVSKKEKSFTDKVLCHINLAHLKIFRYLSDEAYIKQMFLHKMGYRLDLTNPRTFNEKIQWLKLYNRRPEYITMVDKYEAKRYLGQAIGDQYVIPSLGVWDKFDEINFDTLPEQFVLKCTHGWGGVVIVKDKSKLDIKKAKKDIERSLKRNHYYTEREWVYKNIKPRIIAEKYMTDRGNGLIDFKVHNFNGEPKVIVVCEDRFTDSKLTQDYYDCDWNHLAVRKKSSANAAAVMQKPEQLPEMLELSRILSKDIPFVRTDFYVIDGKVYIGELTFYPSAGFMPFIPESFDYELGSYLQLPNEKYN